MKNNSVQRAVRIGASVLLILSLLITVSCGTRNVVITANQFTRTEAQIPNPMKGFACFYEKPDQDASMEYIGVKFSEIYTYENGQGGLETEDLDRKLSEVADRRNSTILRVYILNPGSVSAEETGLFLPEELYSELKASGNIYSNTVATGLLEYPDFNCEKLISCMTEFIQLFGKKYDGHAAIATVQMGLYGSWGEWNMSECRNGKCLMTNENLKRIIEALPPHYAAARVLLVARFADMVFSGPIGFRLKLQVIVQGSGQACQIPVR